MPGVKVGNRQQGSTHIQTYGVGVSMSISSRPGDRAQKGWSRGRSGSLVRTAGFRCGRFPGGGSNRRRFTAVAGFAAIIWHTPALAFAPDPLDSPGSGTINPAGTPLLMGNGGGNLFHQVPGWAAIHLTSGDLSSVPVSAWDGTGHWSTALSAARIARDLEDLPRIGSLETGPLEVVRVSPTPRITYIHLQQVLEGRPILGSHLVLQIDAAGRPVLLRGSAMPGAGSMMAERSPPLPPRILREASLVGLGLSEGDVEWEEDSAAWIAWNGAGGAIGLRPVLRVRFRTGNPPGWWDAAVDEHTGELLLRENRLCRSHQIGGRAYGLIEPATVGDEMERLPFSGMTVIAHPPAFEQSVFTDTLGGFSLDLPHEGEYRLTMVMQGPFARIQDGGRALWTPTDTLRASAPGTVEFLWDESNSHPSHRNAFHHVNRAHSFIRAIDPGEALAPLDDPMTVRVEDQSGYCNAYWNGRRLNFYAAGAGCVSSARIADVVYHEYGHAVTQYCYAPFSTPHDMNEAFSDYFAATMTDQPYIGVGFFGPGTHIREVETVRVWPDDRSPSPHQQGLILAGALWNLRKELGPARTDSLFHFARYGAAQSFDDYMLDLLVWDDDDGNLENGTPHIARITGAFKAHGIGDYSVRIEHEPLPDVEMPGSVVEAGAWIRSLFPPAPDSVSVFYSTGEGYQRLAATAISGTREYRVLIPTGSGEDDDTVRTISYFWAAADTAGNRAVHPPLAPDSVFRFIVGPDLVPPLIEHAQETSVTSDRVRLPLRARVTDNSGNIGRVAAFLRPESGGGGVEHVLEPGPADGVYRGEVELPELVPGSDLLYHLVAEDRAITPNQARSPEYPLEHRVLVHGGTTFTLETDPGPLVPTGDWSWGSPAQPLEAWSGERVWATNLEGTYSANTSSSLLWGPVDLSGFERARLEVRHLHRFEAGYDGGRVEHSHSPAGPWFPLEPEESYPFDGLRLFHGPAFSGYSNGWRISRFPLDGFLRDSQLFIRFRAESDEYLEDLGWYLDDVALVKAQALSLPRDLRILECGPNCLKLEWLAPANVDTLSDRFFGYNIYRSEAGGEFGTDPIHPYPLRSLHYRDRGVMTDVAYRYRLTAIYDEGESRAREASGVPYAPALVVDTDEVRYRLHGVSESDTTLMIMNATGGTLMFNAYLGGPASSLDDLRVEWDQSRAAGDPYELLMEDAPDTSRMVDLASIEARNRDDAELGRLLELRIRMHRPWSDPLRTWGALIWVDTDRNLVTGRADYNLGADYLVALGKLAGEAGHDGPAVLLDPALRPQVGLMGVDFRSRSDSLIVPIPWSLLGNPDDVRILVTLGTSLTRQPFDRLPKLPDLRWLDRLPRHGRAIPGSPQPFSLKFNADSVGVGQFEAMLILASNDVNEPVREIPVHLAVSGLLPREVEDLRFEPGPEGMHISFSLPDEPAALGVGVERAEAGQLVWRRIPPEPLLPDSAGVFHLLDTSVESSVEYLYRFRTLFDGDRLVVYGPHSALYDHRPSALRLRSYGPNPSRDYVSFRLDLPVPKDVRVEIFDASGRRVRDDLGGSFHTGVREILWDGTVTRGRRAPSGIYWVRITVGSWTKTTRIVLVR